MALMNCPDCDNEVSDQASKCLKCGKPIKSHVLKEKLKKVWVKSLLPGLYGIVALLEPQESSKSPMVSSDKEAYIMNKTVSTDSVNARVNIVEFKNSSKSAELSSDTLDFLLWFFLVFLAVLIISAIITIKTSVGM